MLREFIFKEPWHFFAVLTVAVSHREEMAKFHATEVRNCDPHVLIHFVRVTRRDTGLRSKCKLCHRVCVHLFRIRREIAKWGHLLFTFFVLCIGFRVLFSALDAHWAVCTCFSIVFRVRVQSLRCLRLLSLIFAHRWFGLAPDILRLTSSHIRVVLSRAIFRLSTLRNQLGLLESSWVRFTFPTVVRSGPSHTNCCFACHIRFLGGFIVTCDVLRCRIKWPRLLPGLLRLVSLRLVLLIRLILLRIHHHVMDCLDRTCHILHLTLQSNVHDIHVDIDRVITIVALHVEQVLFASDWVLLRQRTVATQLLLQMGIVRIIHRKLRVVTATCRYILARVCWLDLLLSAPPVRIASLNRQRLLLALRSEALIWTSLLRCLLIVLRHRWGQKTVEVILIHTTQTVRGCVSTILIVGRPSIQTDFLPVGTLHLSISHSLGTGVARTRMALLSWASLLIS